MHAGGMGTLAGEAVSTFTNCGDVNRVYSLCSASIGDKSASYVQVRDNTTLARFDNAMKLFSAP